MYKYPELGNLTVYKKEIVTSLGKGYYWNGVTKFTWIEMTKFIDQLMYGK